jgi:hypothetical protein
LAAGAALIAAAAGCWRLARRPALPLCRAPAFSSRRHARDPAFPTARAPPNPAAPRRLPLPLLFHHRELRWTEKFRWEKIFSDFRPTNN